MRILTCTRLWPNAVQPNHGIFVEERMRRVASLPGCSLQVVAPVPWYPRLPWPRKYARLAQVPKSETRHGIEVEHPRYPVIPKVGLRIQGLGLAASILPILKRQNFDVLDSHFLYPDGWAAVTAARQLGKPVVVSARGSDANSLPDAPGMRMLVRRTIEGATMLIAVSRGLAERLVDLGADPAKVVHVPNGVDASAFRPAPATAREAIRASIGVLPGDLLVISVGRLEAVKGHDLLIEAVAALARRPGLNVKLALVGEGSRRGDLARAAKEAGIVCALPGEVPHGELAAWYSAADLFCLPSRGEGHPNALVEALACGTPAVASAVGAAPDILAGGAGLLVLPGDARLLAAALADGLARVRAGAWEEAPIRAAVSGRSWEKVAETVRDVFSEAMARHSVAPRRNVGAP